MAWPWECAGGGLAEEWVIVDDRSPCSEHRWVWLVGVALALCWSLEMICALLLRCPGTHSTASELEMRLLGAQAECSGLKWRGLSFRGTAGAGLSLLCIPLALSTHTQGLLNHCGGPGLSSEPHASSQPCWFSGSLLLFIIGQPGVTVPPMGGRREVHREQSGSHRAGLSLLAMGE